VQPQAPLAAWLPQMVQQTGAARCCRCATATSSSGGDRDRLGARNLGASAAAAAMVMDKAKTLDAAQAAASECPRSWQPQSAEDRRPISAGRWC
jgi:hypothetical protein